MQIARARVRARVDKVAPRPVAFLPRIALIKKRGRIPVMKNLSFRRIVRDRISRFGIVRLCDTGRCSRYYARNIYWRYYECAFALEHGIKRFPLRFFILILLAILRYDILQYCSTNLVFSSRGCLFFFGTRNKEISCTCIRGISSSINISKLPTDCVRSQKIEARWDLCCVSQPFNGFFRRAPVLFKGINKAQVGSVQKFSVVEGIKHLASMTV